MTTYLLHGGQTSNKNERNEKFFSYFTQCVDSDSVTVLLCYFSRAREQWEAKIQQDSQSILANTNKKVTILVAQDPQDLLEKLPDSDVLYVAGGDAEPIEKLYSKMAPMKDMLDGKVFAGSSMGAFVASESYVLSMSDQEENTVHEGLGLLPIQSLCHWDVEKRKEQKLKLLSDYSKSPVVVLNEFETVVLYQ